MDSQGTPSLRRVKPFHLGSLQETTLAPLATTRPRKFRRLLRIDFKNPKEDYTFVQELRSNQGTLVYHQKNYLHPAVIRESFSPTPLPMIELLAQVQHPNIADIIDVYFYDSHLYIVSEYLDVSLLDLEFKRLAPEEWEIATIVAEVIKAMTYLLDTVPTCELYIDSVRLSLYGNVKLVPNVHYQNSQEEYTANHECNSAFLIKLLDLLMSYGTSSDGGWSREALEFSSIQSSDSFMSSMNHVFLSKAVSSSRLVPRIRLATQMLGSQSRVCPGDHVQPSPGQPLNTTWQKY